MRSQKGIIDVLPNGEYGPSSAASVTSDMLYSFPNVKIGLIVGIRELVNGVRLGDIFMRARVLDSAAFEILARSRSLT